MPAAQSSFAGSKRALQPAGSDTRPSATPSCASQAASTASCTSFTCAGRSQPSPIVGEAVARAGVLQAGPVDHRHAAENAVEIVRVALRHGQAFAPAFGDADEVQLLRRAP